MDKYDYNKSTFSDIDIDNMNKRILELERSQQNRKKQIEELQNTVFGLNRKPILDVVTVPPMFETPVKSPQLDPNPTAPFTTPITPPDTPVIAPPFPQSTPQRTRPKARILLVVGHNAIVKGAYSEFLQQHEYDFNLALARRLEGSWTEARNKITGDYRSETCKNEGEIHILYRDSNITRTEFALQQISPYVRNNNIDFIIELHFNSFSDPEVNGSELLHSSTNDNAIEFFTRFHDILVNNLLRRDRGVKLLQPQDRGYTNVSILRERAHNNVPYCLLEPFFGSNANDSDTANLQLGPILQYALRELSHLIIERKIERYGHNFNV